MGGKRSKRRSSGKRMDPNIYVLEDASIATADTVVNSTLLTNGQPARMRIRMRRAQLITTGGSGSSRVFWLIRRVPQGYSAPSITVTSGLTVYADQPDILGIGFRASSSTDTAPLQASWQWIKRSVILYEGDSLVLQCVPNTSDSGLVESGQIEFGSCFV